LGPGRAEAPWVTLDLILLGLHPLLQQFDHLRGAATIHEAHLALLTQFAGGRFEHFGKGACLLVLGQAKRTSGSQKLDPDNGEDFSTQSALADIAKRLGGVCSVLQSGKSLGPVGPDQMIRKRDVTE